MSRRLLILRPEPGATHTAERAREIGFNTTIYPLFVITSLAWESPDPAGFDAALFTSANAVRHAGADLARYRHLPAFAVGETTAQAVRNAGFVDVVAGRSGVQDIVQTIAARGHPRVLHMAGRNARPFDAGPLHMTLVCVYEARELGDGAGLAAVAEANSIVLVHSPRAGRRLAALLPIPRRESLYLVAISPAALEAAGTGWASAIAVGHPDDTALLALAAGLCE